MNFTLPAYNVPQLRTLKGFESFNPATEVLHCDKPGTGSVDAPRCFSMKLSKVTNKCGLVPSNIDPELCYLHKKSGDNLVLVAIMTKHVDDLKVAGEPEVVLQIMKMIEETFGSMKLIWHEFTNCGVRHIQDKTTCECSLDQTEYISGLKTISHDEIRGKSSNSYCEPLLHTLYQSLLGAVAFTSLTRVDIIVFVVALQRHTHKPQVIHVKRLNALVRWMQANPRKLMYRSFNKASKVSLHSEAHPRAIKPSQSGPFQHLKVIADSSFKKEEEKGHSLRGVLHLRCAGRDYTQGGTVHILDFATKALRLVTRSTYSSELLGACDSIDHGLMLLYILHEIHSGVPTKHEAKLLRERGRFAVPCVLYIDALSVYASATATYIKAPAEKGLLSHVQYLRELMDNRVLDALAWQDTRDMAADGLTKGSVERTLLHKLMNGELTFQHAPKVWRPLTR